jgi:hypothetical protein
MMVMMYNNDDGDNSYDNDDGDNSYDNDDLRS